MPVRSRSRACSVAIDVRASPRVWRERVETRVVPGPDRAAFLKGRGCVGGYGPPEHLAHVLHGVEPGAPLPQPGELGGRQRAPHRGDPVEGTRQREQVARHDPAQRDLSRQALKVGDLGERLANVTPHLEPLEELPHHLLAFPDGVRFHQRCQQPAPQRARAHGRDGVVQHRDEGGALVSRAQRLGQLQVPARHLVDHHGRAGTAHDGRLQVRQPAGADLRDVGEQGARGAHRGRITRLDAESLQGEHSVGALRFLARRLLSEDPVVAEGDQRVGRRARQGLPLQGSGQEQLGRRQLAHAGGEGLFADNLEHQFARGQVEGGQTAGLLRRGRERDQEVVAPGLQQLVVDDRAGSDGLNHLAAHQPLGRPGILDLVADGYPATQLHQLAQVVVQRLGGHARERDLPRRPVVACRQGQPEQARTLARVLVEELEEIAYPDEHQGIAMARLHGPPLAHERCVLGHGVALVPEIIPRARPDVRDPHPGP